MEVRVKLQGGIYMTKENEDENNFCKFSIEFYVYAH